MRPPVRPSRPFLALLLAGATLLTVDAPARAFVAEETADRAPARTQAGGGAAAPRRRPPPPPDLDERQVRNWAMRMRVVLERCMQRAHPDQAFRVRLVIRYQGPQRRMMIRSRVLPANGQAALQRCLPDYQRRLEARVRRFASNRGFTVPVDFQLRPRETNPTPPPPPERTGDLASRVDGALARVASRIRGCFPASARVRGEARFQVEVRPDGSLAMVGASLPPGLGNPQTLQCAASAIGSVRLVRPPSAVRRVEAKLELR